MRNPVVAGLLLAVLTQLTASSGCTEQAPSRTGGFMPLRASEVLRVNGRIVSLTQFANIREHWPQVAPGDRLWAAIAAAVLCTRRERFTGWVSATDTERDCLHLALYATGKLESRQEETLVRQLTRRVGNAPDRAAFRAQIEAETARSAVEKNTELLAEIQ